LFLGIHNIFYRFCSLCF